MDSGRPRWFDEAAGPVVRPYAITRGRTRPQGASIDVVTILVCSGRRLPQYVRLSPEQHRVLELCRTPHALAELASELSLPLCVVEVLVSELIEHGLLDAQEPAPVAQPDQRLLRRVLDELRAL